MKCLIVRASDPLGRLTLPLEGTRFEGKRDRLWTIQQTEDGFLVTPCDHSCSLCGKPGNWPKQGRYFLCPDCLRELEEK